MSKSIQDPVEGCDCAMCEGIRQARAAAKEIEALRDLERAVIAAWPFKESVTVSAVASCLDKLSRLRALPAPPESPS